MIFDHCSIVAVLGQCRLHQRFARYHAAKMHNQRGDQSATNQSIVDGSDRNTIVRNHWVDDQSRNPKGKANLQFINNVVYNWGSNGYVGGHSGTIWNEDLINSYFIKGPSSTGSFLAQFSSTDHFFQSGNLVDLDRDGSLNGRTIVEADFRENQQTAGFPTFSSKPFNDPARSRHTSVRDGRICKRDCRFGHFAAPGRSRQAAD